jgi:transposase
MDLRYSKLTIYQRNRLIEHFIAGATARMTADLVGLNRNTVRLFFHRLREIIASQQSDLSMMEGEIEVDESYFGGVRKGKRGRGAAGKVIVFGLLKRGGEVHVVTVEDTKTDTLLPVIRSKIKPDSVVYTDSYKSYNALDVSEFKHFRINHSKLFADKHNHINGIENFWNQAKRHMRKFNGIPKQHFNLFIKECEFRFNNPHPKTQLQLLKLWLKIHKST